MSVFQILLDLVALTVRWFLNGFEALKTTVTPPIHRSGKFSVFTKALLTFSLLFTALSYSYLRYYFPYQPLSLKSTFFVFELSPKSSLINAITLLEKKGMLNKPQALCTRIWIKWINPSPVIQAGEYALSYNMTPFSLLEKMERGDVIRYALTLKEGLTYKEMMQTLFSHSKINQTLFGKNATDVMILLNEKELNVEGVFFPDTYYFPANTSDFSLLSTARTRMKKQLQKVWEERAADLSINTPYEALILASLIEKEAVLDHERFIISGVFHRRLRKKMRLQTDPTVMYGLQKYSALTKKDLMTPTPYNTYLYKGLPPTPIALPGLRAMLAALHPDKSEVLYFVAKKDGSHQFSSTLKEHNEAVAKYQRSVLS